MARMTSNGAREALEAFASAARRVPAYQKILSEAGIRVEDIKFLGDFVRLPILEKRSTFERFEVEELCLDGRLGRPGMVLTSSGHSGIFAFGITDIDQMEVTANWVDDALDTMFAVRSRSTLLVNCLPMGVKVASRACTLAETSVRPDMVVGLIKSLGRHFDQIILVGDAAFVKHVLEMGKRTNLDWRSRTVHVILGEELLAENARRYLAELLGHDLQRPEKGVVFSSMGVAEIGLNLFFEMPPSVSLILLRSLLHDDCALRKSVLGASDWVPSLFTYDPSRIYVEFDDTERLIITTLDQNVRIPLIRYAPGDYGRFVNVPAELRPILEARGIAWNSLNSVPIVAISGRGEHALCGGARVYPEAVKEGLYLNPSLAELTTANFRLASGEQAIQVRIQLSQGVTSNSILNRQFAAVVSEYVRAPCVVECHEYEKFRGGLALDYERKFRYLER